MLAVIGLGTVAGVLSTSSFNVAVPAMMLFWHHARRLDAPLILLKLFGDRTFAMGSLVSFSSGPCTAQGFHSRNMARPAVPISSTVSQASAELNRPAL